MGEQGQKAKRGGVGLRGTAAAAASLALAFSCLTGAGAPAFASEDATQFYLLGSKGPLAGITPPPGTYATSIKYYYSGDASGAAADSVVLDQIGNLTLEAEIDVDAQLFLEVPFVQWIAPQKILGGNFGLGLLLPMGWKDISADVDALATLTIDPIDIGGVSVFEGTTLQRGRRFSFGDDTVNVGDPVPMAMLGWHHGNLHWNVTGLLNVPIGAYDEDDIANLGFNRWIFDASAAATWLDPAKGFEASATAGFSFHSENPDTNYTTGTEFHVEWALQQHFSEAFAVGLVGFHFEQVTGDSGLGATLGPFRGRVTALGPNINYNFNLGQLPVATSLRWYHDFNVKNRLEGDLGVFTATIPLGGGG
jgi:hypothetical protein